MTGPPVLRSEDVRRGQLVVSKRRATGLLAVVAVLWLIVTIVARHSGWAGYVQATAEASLVGGLADWFAVTALFRRPLGLPIPHTAIIVERKDQFAATLGGFIQESFLTPAVVVERVRNADVLSRLGQWLAQPDNAARVATQVIDGLGAVTDWVGDDEIGDTVEGFVRRRLDMVEVAPLAGRVLRTVLADGREGHAIDALLRMIDHYLEVHGEDLRHRFAEESPWWLPGPLEERVFDRLMEGARELLADRDQRLRQELAGAIEQFIGELETSPAMAARVEQMKIDFLAQPQIHDWAGGLWPDAKRQILAQGADPDSELAQWLVAAITRAAERVASDVALRNRFEEVIESAVTYIVDNFNGEISSLVQTTIGRWDGLETSRRLELLLGPDLQYIRINGTVVGGLAGLVLYALSRAL